MSKLGKLTDLLDRLDGDGIHYTLSSVREGAVLVGVSLPGERWEVEFLSDGEIEIEVFASAGPVQDYSIIDELFRRHTEA